MKISANINFKSRFSNVAVVLYAALILIVVAVGFFLPGSHENTREEAGTYFVIVNEDTYESTGMDPIVEPVIFIRNHYRWYGLEYKYFRNYICYGSQIWHVTDDTIEKVDMEQWSRVEYHHEVYKMVYVLIAVIVILLYTPIVLRLLLINQGKKNYVSYESGYLDGCSAGLFGKKMFRLEKNNDVRLEVKQDKLRNADQLLIIRGTEITKIYCVQDADAFIKNIEE